MLGEDRFRAREAIAGLLGDGDDVDVSRYQGDRVVTGALLDELRTPSMFGKPRAVVVQDAGAKDLFKDESLDALAAYAASPAPNSLLILQAKSLDGRLKAAKALKAAATVVDCKPLPDGQVQSWLAQRGRETYGLYVPPAAARALRERIGEDLGLLDGALERLRDQIAPRTEVLPSDVEESTEEHRSPVMWEAANALQAGDLQAALTAIGAGFSDGIRIRQDIVTDPRAVAPILLSNLHGAYKNLMRFHMVGGDAKSLGVSSGAAFHLGRNAERHRFDRLLRRHRLFVDADLALKRSEDAPRRVIEHLLVGLLADDA